MHHQPGLPAHNGQDHVQLHGMTTVDLIKVSGLATPHQPNFSILKDQVVQSSYW